jgi:hypothetical protein
MILNEDLRFVDLDATVKLAFRGVPDRISLTPNVQLYKWTSHPLVHGTRITPWWSFVQTTRLPSGMVAEGFRIAEERAARLGKSHREFTRARAAVSGQFGNTMSNLLVIRLNVQVWGFAGQASGQREFADEERELRDVYLIGGGHQVWIPNLTPRHVTPIPALG